MNAKLSRDELDDVQVRALRDREEKKRARQIVHDELLEDQSTSLFLAVLWGGMMLAGFVASIALIVVLAIAWNVTGDGRFLLLLGGVVVGIVGGWAHLFRKHPDGVGR